MKKLRHFSSYLLVAFLLASCTDELIANEPNTEPPVRVSGTLPVLYIETENHAPVTSKTQYLPACYWLDAMNRPGATSLGSKDNPLPMQIRGRGHSSWKGAKKPYKIRLDDKAAMMGMPRNRHWALLQATENTVAGLYLGKLMDMVWTPDFRPVEVVLNGEYAGFYFLTETIRIDKDRVNIFEQEEGETDPQRITGGWLVEVDNYYDECQITIPECSRWSLTLRYHSPEVLSNEQRQWLIDEFKAINAAVYAADKHSTAWEDYLDVESMARFFIIQEIMDNPDGFHGSFYLHKDLGNGAKWVAGPLWDLVCYNREKTDYTFRMKVHYGFTPHWIGELIQYDSFCQAVASIWKSVYPQRLSAIYDYIDATVLPLDLAWQYDCERWNGDSSNTAQARAEKIKNALRRNMDWFDAHIPTASTTSLPDTAMPTDGSVKVYSLQGILIGEYGSEREARSALKKGIYIVNKKKIRIE